MIQRSERFTKAYNSLVRAFFEGTLTRGSCLGCACGNIIFDAVGEHISPEDVALDRKVLISEDEFALFLILRMCSYSLWAVYRTVTLDKKFFAHPLPGWENRVNEAGYTTKEFAQIEMAFENACSIGMSRYSLHSEQEILEDQYKGLCAVVDVLLELEGESQGGDELKTKFREHPVLVTQ